MILLGMILILISFIGLVLLLRKKLYRSRRFLKVLLFALPLPYLANELGWIAAEVGRQPWAVFRVLRTTDAVSKVVPAVKRSSRKTVHVDKENIYDPEGIHFAYPFHIPDGIIRLDVAWGFYRRRKSIASSTL